MYLCAHTGLCDGTAGFWISTTSAGWVPQKDTGLTVFLSHKHIVCRNSLRNTHTCRHRHKYNWLYNYIFCVTIEHSNFCK